MGTGFSEGEGMMGRKTVKSGAIVTTSPRWQALIDGDMSVQDLEDDEILTGRLRMDNGKLAPRGVNVIPRRLHEAMMRELKFRMQNKFAEEIEGAIDQLVWVMYNGETRDMVKLQAAQTIIERVLGKVESKQTVTLEATPWQQAIEAGDLLVDVDQQPILDVEVVNDVPTTRASAPARAPVRRRRARAEE
jgi:hypothetical protein